eukprot:g34868.t1
MRVILQSLLLIKQSLHVSPGGFFLWLMVALTINVLGRHFGTGCVILVPLQNPCELLGGLKIPGLGWRYSFATFSCSALKQKGLRAQEHQNRMDDEISLPCNGERESALPWVMATNLRSAVTVALVSLSLSIALGIASGTTPVAGLATAIWGGLTMAGALCGMLKGYSLHWGPEILPWISICSAACIFLVRVFRMQGYLLIMPKSVFEGFTLAVGIIIGLGQLNNAFGIKPAEQHEKFFLNVGESFKAFDTATWHAAALFAPLFLSLFILMRKVPSVPWMTVLPVASILIGWLSFEGKIDWKVNTLKTKYGELNTMDVFKLPDPHVLKEAFSDGPGELLMAIFSVAFVAVLETLISAKIGEFKSGFGFDQAQETLGLGATHIMCGLLGGMPCTGVFVRTSINIDLGATHRMSQFMNAAIVLIVTLAAMPVMLYLPLPSIAAVLVTASLRMMPFHYLGELWKHDKGSFALCIFVAALCVVEDPVIGLVVGTLVALLRVSESIGKSHDTVDHEFVRSDSHSKVRIRGPLTFQSSDNLRSHRKCLGIVLGPSLKYFVFCMRCARTRRWLRKRCKEYMRHPNSTTVTIDLSHMTYVDMDGLEQLLKLASQASINTNVLVQEHENAKSYPLDVLPSRLGALNSVDRMNARRAIDLADPNALPRVQ